MSTAPMVAKAADKSIPDKAVSAPEDTIEDAGTLEWIKVRELHVHWPDAQRALSMSKAKEIAEEFDPDAFGSLIVCTGKNLQGYHTIDGWTRANAVLTKYGPDERVPCMNLGEKTKQEAAAIFAVVNGGRTKPTPIQTFVARVTSNDPVYVDIDQTVREFGLKLDQSSAVGSLRCAGVVVSIYNQHGQQGLHKTLDFLIKVWRKERSAYDGQIVLGAAHFLHTNEYASIAKVAARVAKRYTPARLIAGAKATREAFGGSTARAVAALLREAASVTVKPIVK